MAPTSGFSPPGEPGSGLWTILGPEPDGATLGAWGDGSIFGFLPLSSFELYLEQVDPLG